MKVDVGPLMDAIDRYVAKADDDLEETLTAEGFVAADYLVQKIREIEDGVAEALGIEADFLDELIGEAGSIEDIVDNVLPEVRESDELLVTLRDLFAKQFDESIRKIAREWTAHDIPEVLKDVITVPDDGRITLSTEDFITTWSGELANKMHLTTKNQIENILMDAYKNNRTIDEVSEAVADSGIREYGYRSRRVAVTEVLRIESYAHQESMTQNPLAYKKTWHHNFAIHPRENHIDMDGQTVFKRETFTLIGRDGSEYFPMCPRDTCLPASESVNCHCSMEEISDETALGITDDEWQKMRDDALDAADAEWEAEHAHDKIDSVKAMDEKDKLRYFGGKKNDGEVKQALVDSGVIDTDKKLDSLWKTEASGKKSMKSLQELTDDGIFTVSDKVLSHSTQGELKGASTSYPNGRLSKGGHAYSSIEALKEKGIESHVTYTFSNGVSAGYVKGHRSAYKNGNVTASKPNADIGQSWFPESWTDQDIRNAGTYVANKPESIDGAFKAATYNGVRVGVYCNEAGSPTTIFPDNMKQPDGLVWEEVRSREN